MKETIPEWGKLKLSKNFSLWELCRSDRYPELVSPPSPAVIYWLKWWAQEALQPLRDIVGRIRVNSGYRNPALNRAVGGEKGSFHQVVIDGVFVAVATDVVPLDCSVVEMFRIAAQKSIILPIRGAIIYPDRGFIHLDSRDGAAKFFTSTVPKKYEQISRAAAMKMK